MRRNCLAPLVDEGTEDAGRDAVVGGDVLVVRVAGDKVLCWDEAAGVDAVHLVEGMDREGCELKQIARECARWDEARFWWGEFGFGRGHSQASLMLVDCRGARGLRAICVRGSTQVRGPE